jgi:hypothetical protein
LLPSATIFFLLLEQERLLRRVPPLDQLPPARLTAQERIWLIVMRAYLVITAALVVVRIDDSRVICADSATSETAARRTAYSASPFQKATQDTQDLCPLSATSRHPSPYSITTSAVARRVGGFAVGNQLKFGR